MLAHLWTVPAMAGQRDFTFERYLSGGLPTLNAWIVEMNETTGYVLVNGCDSQGPSIPFTWNWGDNQVNDGWFPQDHTYADISRNYILTITAHYDGDETDSTQVLIRFVPPEIDPLPIPEEVAVSVPDSLVELTSRMPGYGIPDDLVFFGDEFFTVISRSAVEYLLSVTAFMQKGMVNDDLFQIDGGFRQVVLRDADFPGMYSLWYTSPVSFAAADYAFQGTVQWSSFMHEMGHNVTLNFPAGFYYGGKIDGCANAIYSETMAQIFQHATAYEMINQGEAYGLSDDLIFDIQQNAIQTIGVVRNAYERYISEGMNFASWNDPVTPEDETFDTFMTLAYKFCAHAEGAGEGYAGPAGRMTRLLSVFNEDLQQRYDQQNDTAEADTFRATLMVTAESFAFDTDLRDEFRDLNFPISDATYEELLVMAADVDEGDDIRYPCRVALACSPNPLQGQTEVWFQMPADGRVLLGVYDLRGREVCALADRVESPGWRRVSWNGMDGQGRPVASGVYLIRLKAGNQVGMAKVVVLR